MIIHANTTREDFIEFLYYACADAGMGTLVLDQIDHLRAFTDLEADLEQKGETLGAMEKDRDDLEEELKSLADSVDDVLGCDDLPKVADRILRAALQVANRAIERHADDRYDE